MNNPVTLLVVENLQTSKLFYLDVLGMTLREDNHNCIKLSIGQHQVLMFEGSEPSVDYRHGYNANSTLVFAVENLADKIEELKTKGVVFVHKSPNENKWGRYAAFKDPSGIIHELMEFN